MTCTSCGKANLPGGLRCAYCGSPLAETIDFDIGGDDAPEALAPGPPPVQRRPSSAASQRAGFAGVLIILALKAKSLLVLVKLGKVATTLVSMMAFIAADGAIFGWRLGVAIAVSILVHELGHVTVNWRKGLKQSAPMFIPFLGAVIFVKRFPDDPTVQAECGAGGPAAGALAALVCIGLGLLTGDRFWFTVAYLGFMINLFNLLPFAPLDGASMATVFSPRIWSVVLAILLLWALKLDAPILWPILLIGFLARLGMQDEGRHMLAMPSTRVRMAALYIVLCVGMAYGAERSAELRHLHEAPPAAVAQSIAEPGASPHRAALADRDESDLAATRATQVVVFGALATIIILLMATWAAVPLLLSAASDSSAGLRAFRASAAMLALGVALYGASRLLGHGTAIMGGYLAATGAAVAYSVYAAIHGRDARVRMAYSLHFSRMMAWAVAGAALVVYTTEDLVAGSVLIAVMAGFYARYRWMLVGLAASAREQLGDVAGAIRLRERALAMHPDDAAAAAMLASAAHGYLLLEHGEAALDTLDRRAALVSEPENAETRVLVMRAHALALVSRYDDALAQCEAILNKPVRVSAQSAKLFTVHRLLAIIARLRGWTDEAQAQADWCLSAAPKSARIALAELRALRAAAAADAGDYEAAQSDCDLLRKISREPRHEAAAATVLAEVRLAAGDLTRAVGLVERAVRAMPGHLGVQFWRGRVLAASDRRNDGVTILRDLASRYAGDYWGRRAAELTV